MELRHLRYFVAVAEEGTFARAAARLRAAQPALSRQIRDLERELDVSLFEDGGRAAHLSPAGEALLREARSILQGTALAMARARRTSRGLAGHCAVCAGNLPTWTGLVARLIAAVRRDYPFVELGVTEGSAVAQWDAVRSGAADLGIGIAPTREYADLARWKLAVHSFDSALLPASHPLAGRARIRVADLEGTPIIGMAGTNEHRAMCSEVASRLVPAPVVRDATSFADLFAQVAAGAGWTPFDESLSPWRPPGTEVVPVEDLNCSLPMCVIWKAGDLPAVVRRVRGVLAALARERVGAKVSTAAAIDPDRSMAVAPLQAATERAVERAEPDGELPLALELRHLRYFLAVVEAGSIGRAAERVSITQPALSRQMHDLERLVGVPLLERNPKGVAVTAAGETFSYDAQRLLAAAADVRAETHRATRGDLRRCVVATIPAPSVARLIASISRAASAEMPDVQITLTEVPTPRQPEALLAAQIDIGVCHAFTSVTPYLRDLHRHSLLDDPACCALVAPDHPLATRGEITLGDLSDVPFLFMPRSLYPAFYDRVMTYFADRGFQPRVEQAYDGLQTTWSLARRGEGWCIGFETNLRYPPAALAAVLVRDLDIPLGIEMLYRRDETRSAVLGVVELIRRAADAASAAPSAEGRPARTPAT